MATFRDLRKTVRESLDDPRLAVVFFETDNSSSYHFANVLNLGIQGVLIESDRKFENGIKPKLMLKNPELDQWDTFFCRVAWAQTTESEKQYKTGLEFLFPVDNDNGIEPEPGIKGDLTPQDIDFLLTTRLFKAVPKGFLCSLLNCLSRRSVARNIRFMSRENPQNCLYIIHKGSCRIEFKNKTGLFEPIGKRREGDVIGDMAFLSIEPLISDAVSETEMVVWELPAAKFDQACRLQQGLIDFLTGLLTNRFDDPTDPELKTVGRHIITELIGEGRTGFVYKGLHKPLNLPVAVKMLKHHQVAQKDGFNRFKQKISRIAGLNHPHIVRIYDIEEQYRTFFIVMEYIEGESLDSLFGKNVTLSLDKGMLFLAQICSALAHAHEEKIFHKHLTPSNIFILKGHHILVSDFGWAAPIPDEEFMEDRNIYYLAPEHIKGERINQRSDVYSLGILTYEMLTGLSPFSGEGRGTAPMNRNTAGKTNGSFVGLPDLPEFIQKFILKACAELPEMRYSSIQDVIRELSGQSAIFNNALTLKQDMEQEISTLLVSHKINQRQALFRLLDEFSQKALDLGMDVNITGKIQIRENHQP